MTNPRLHAVKPLARFLTTPCLSLSSRSLYLAPSRFAAAPVSVSSPSMGLFRNFFSGPPSPGTMADAKNKVQDLIDNNGVVVFSKSYCPYCRRAKGALSSLDIEYKALELDNLDDGSELQAALLELTGQRTVPNIFIGKQHVGGSDDLSDLIHNKAELQKLLDKAFPQ